MNDEDEPDPRITRSDLDDAARVTKACLDRLIVDPPNAITTESVEFIRRAMAYAFAEYPADRSCYTCDHFFAGRCSVFKAEPPKSYLLLGCVEHDDSGIPF